VRSRSDLVELAQRTAMRLGDRISVHDEESRLDGSAPAGSSPPCTRISGRSEVESSRIATPLE